MENEYFELADYYWEQAARVTVRAKSTDSQEHQQTLLLLARRWEKLALEIETSRQPPQPLAQPVPANVVEISAYRANKKRRAFHIE